MLDHFYMAFRLFYGPLSAFIFLKKFKEL